MSHIESSVPVDDEFYIQSDPLPDQPFYICLHGYLASGSFYVRLYETLITPSKVGIDINLATSVLSAPPDSTVYAEFEATNYGGDATYNFYVTDDKGYVTAFEPSE